MTAAASKVNFDAPATLHKWPSLGNRRRQDRNAYLVLEATLDKCITALMEKPEPTRHLYEIHTAPQPPLVTETLSPDHIVELSRLREFL
ncbi:hypothetical protein JQ596_09375 [Bradyrhizobium manausense]|uniref:hypothetical protein n=1 Tax=Bradyrhizobium TaxID=374 RepID=UPI001BA79441|nr:MULTISPECIES: hypothetical protein [Bradyrhizobium]MBR0825748.1 hypothetical protein [Bradyrhizobium manausense]UVO31306.1 hypothetical protein KUF59_11975 [Bradyrhizobium arachidis]